MLQCSSKSHSLTPRKTIMVIICTNAPWKPVWTHAFNEFVLDNIHFCPAFQRQITQFTMCLPVKHLQRRTESEPPLNALSLRLKLSVQSLFARAVGVEEGTPSLPRTGRAQRTRNLLIHSSNNTSTRCFRAVNNSVQKKKKKNGFAQSLIRPDGWLQPRDALHSISKRSFTHEASLLLLVQCFMVD